MTMFLGKLAGGIYYGFIAMIATLAIVSTLVWLYRVYVLGHMPEHRPRWLKRPIKEVLHAYFGRKA